ncbi:hypothetical protein L4D20_00670 [Vibrio kyushuensis]|uniref:hypothetical protein n=1 Tax=Vibrio kyushuensis TaxID=2910249 RepID=UPI003D12F02B
MYKQYWLRFVSIFAAALLPYSTANACAFHMSEQDNVMSFQTADYRHTLAVTLATNKAISEGDLQPFDEVLSGESGFRQISWWLHLLAQQLTKDDFPSSHIVIIDVPLWSQYHLGNGRMAEIDIPKPSDDKANIALTQSTLYSLASEQIDLLQAVELGLLRVD